VNKAKGLTSYDVIRKLKRILPPKQKIGHAGSLDPFATGLLIVMLGKATKLFRQFQKLKKGYRAVAEAGYETDTNDPEGEIIFEDEEFTGLDRQKLIETLEKFKGNIKQTPPIYSAKKYAGKRAYELARQGKSPKLMPRIVSIYHIKLVGMSKRKFEIEVVCSSGTYIRKLIADIAREMGTYATNTKLRRQFIGEFNIKESVNSNNLNLKTVKDNLIDINESER
jgi:tRNA pseudouridine55 synthase